jgi:hypothetical protein
MSYWSLIAISVQLSAATTYSFDAGWLFNRGDCAAIHPAGEPVHNNDNSANPSSCTFFNDTDIDPHTAGLGDAAGKNASECCAQCSRLHFVLPNKTLLT